MKMSSRIAIILAVWALMFYSFVSLSISIKEHAETAIAIYTEIEPIGWEAVSEADKISFLHHLNLTFILFTLYQCFLLSLLINGFYIVPKSDYVHKRNQSLFPSISWSTAFGSIPSILYLLFLYHKFGNEFMIILGGSSGNALVIGTLLIMGCTFIFMGTHFAIALTIRLLTAPEPPEAVLEC